MAVHCFSAQTPHEANPTLESAPRKGGKEAICDHLPKKVRRLERECDCLKKSKYYMPDLRPLKTDAIREQVYAALADGPKTKRDLDDWKMRLSLAFAAKIETFELSILPGWNDYFCESGSSFSMKLKNRADCSLL
jgi:hypothetical protein